MNTDVVVHTLTAFLRNSVEAAFGRSIAIVGVSGGVDSAVTVALCARALGPDRTLGVLLPERESSSASVELAQHWCEQLGVPFIIDDVTDALTGFGCYERRDAAVSSLIPQYQPGVDRVSVRLVQDLRASRLPARYLVQVIKPSGEVIQRRPTGSVYRSLFAASNFKQRVRTTKLYYYAELNDGCVIGTSNLDEEYLGFFVKIGDGTWDACPLEAFTKSEVRALAAHIGVDEAIQLRPTTTDTFPVDEQSQEDMFYSLPFNELDILLECLVGRRTPESAAADLAWPDSDVDNALHNLRRRHRSTEWNRLQSLRPQAT